jgi:histidine kinase
MAKVAGNRYQNAFTLATHLERCADDMERHRVTSFPLTEGDVSERFELQQKLYGREKEIDVLLSTFDRACEGRAEMVLVAGHSGIGKSALIQEVYKPITKRRGYFASGKFDQYNRDIPYASLIQAIKELVRQILTEPKENLAAWKHHILEAIRPNAQLIIDVIPDAKLIIGEQPEVADLPPMEAQNRFNLTFEKFFGVFASNEHPLAVFLDDLQWADLPSLVLLERLMANAETKHMLLIGAYRDNEVGAAHPLVLSLEAIRKHGAPVHTIMLNPLGVDDCVELIGDALRASQERVASLAQVCYEKTGGNPFFLRQFLISLYDARQIDFDHETGQFHWDIAALRHAQMTDNVVELMAAKIQKFSVDTQRILQLASCIATRAIIYDCRSPQSRFLARRRPNRARRNGKA